MNELKERVFLTGATGVMGSAGLAELTKYPERYQITVLARPSKRNKMKLNPFISKGVSVIWGDLLDRNVIKQGVENADIILHVGGMVSPAAEHYPEKTMKVNIGSMRLISEEVTRVEREDPDREIKVVYIGSVSQYGSNLPPDHWGKVGDRLSAAKYDAYALSKILAERALVEAGLKKWVSLRQTAILHAGLMNKANDPVAFHVPLNGVIEWISVEDSGRVLEAVCRPDLPEDFWCNFYNIGGGESFRLTNYEFEKKLLKAMGCGSPEKIFEPNWFAADNFHGIWFEDSDILDQYLHFRKNDTFENCIARIKKTLPAYFKLTPLVPSFLIKSLMKKVAGTKELGPLYWIAENIESRIRVSWGSKKNYDDIQGWKDFPIIIPSKDNLHKQEKADKVKHGVQIFKKMCKEGHEFRTSEILEYGGHWCPECLKKSVMEGSIN